MSSQATLRSYRRVTGALIVSLACTSCAGRPLQGVLVPVEAVESTSRVPVLVATTRERAAADTGDMFNRERAATMSYAMVSVSIPPDEARVVGAIQWPAVPPGDPRREFVTVSADYLDKAAFNTTINTVAKTTRRSKAMIFIHGFNNRFDDAVYRFAQIVQDFEGPGHSDPVLLALARPRRTARLRARQRGRPGIHRIA